MSGKYMPEGQRAQIVFDRALAFLGEEMPLRRKLREREFIDAAAAIILWPLRTITEMETREEHMDKVREFFDEIGREIGDAPYDGSNPNAVYTWAGDALEYAGVVGESNQEEFEADEVAVIPQSVFDSVLHEVEAGMKLMAQSLEGWAQSV